MGYTGYEESEKVVLDPNDTSFDGSGLKSGSMSPAAINNYSNMTPSKEVTPGTHVNRAYMMDDEDDR